MDTTPPHAPYLLLPDPGPATVTHTLCSVDDHVVEPPHTFEGRLPARLQDDAPRVVPGPDGADYWLVEGRLEPNIGTNGVAGRPIEEWDIAPMRFDELREGTWSVEQRLRDMDLNGVHRSEEHTSDLQSLMR